MHLSTKPSLKRDIIELSQNTSLMGQMCKHQGNEMFSMLFPTVHILVYVRSSFFFFSIIIFLIVIAVARLSCSESDSPNWFENSNFFNNFI